MSSLKHDTGTHESKEQSLSPSYHIGVVPEILLPLFVEGDYILSYRFLVFIKKFKIEVIEAKYILSILTNFFGSGASIFRLHIE